MHIFHKHTIGYVNMYGTTMMESEYKCQTDMEFLELPDIRYSLITVTEFPQPPRWLAITEPTPPPQWFTVFSVVFHGGVS